MIFLLVVIDVLLKKIWDFWKKKNLNKEEEKKVKTRLSLFEIKFEKIIRKPENFYIKFFKIFEK